MPSTRLSCQRDEPPELCGRCDLDPCACSYITDLRPGGPLDHLRDIAVAQMTEPFPHRAACPCPACYSMRMATFEDWIRSRPGRCSHGYAPEQTFHRCDEQSEGVQTDG